MIHLGVAATLVAASTRSSDGNWSLIGLAFFAAGFIFYGYIFARYRNAGKRYHYESRTMVVKNNVQARDDYTRSRNGQSSSTMDGANNQAVFGAQNTMSKISGSLGGQQGSVQNIINKAIRYRPDK